MMENKEIRIRVNKISKKFDLERKASDNALSRILFYLFRKQESKQINVLDNVSFEVKAGEIMGLIGRNGSGKSTLLRIIAEVYFPDTGEVKTHGKVIYLGGRGQILTQNLTMRENIYLVGSMMGLSQKDIGKKFSTIVEFSGLKEFVDTKVYKFSSGMVTRLAFSIMIHCVKHHNPDILLLDEVFGGGGDIDFHDRAAKIIEEIIKGGAAVILVSHSLEIIKRYSDEVIWLDEGKIFAQGNSKKIVSRYSASYKNKK